MKLIKLNEVRWDIVRRNAKSPWVLLGWPIRVTDGVSRELIRVRKRDDNIHAGYLAIRRPFSPTITWKVLDDNGDFLPEGESYPVISYRTVTFLWLGWLWFWRAK